MFAVNGLIAGWNMYTRQDGGKRKERFIGFAVTNVCGNTKVCTQLHRKTWYDVMRRNGGTGHPPFLRGFLHGHYLRDGGGSLLPSSGLRPILCEVGHGAFSENSHDVR